VNEHDPIRNDARWKRRERELGRDAGCVLCGERDLCVLVEVKGEMRERLLERHHVVGWANDPSLKVLLCRNCHAKETESQRQYGIDLDRETKRNMFVIVEMFLRAVAIFLARLAERCWQLADLLAAQLDASLPEWRDRPNFSH